MALPTGWRAVRVLPVCVLKFVVHHIDVVPFAQKVVANMDINVHTSPALSKAGAYKDVWFVVCWQHGIHVWTCGSQFVSNMEFAYKMWVLNWVGDM